MTTEPIDLFYSYAHEDETLLKQLNKHLASLQQQGIIRAWHDRDILAGGLWAQEISSHLQTARIILLLISPEFLASDYCYGNEMTEALKRHASGQARVIPILLRPCDWQSSPFAQLQALPKNAKAVTLWTNRDAALTDVAKGVREVIEAFTKKTGTAVPSAAEIITSTHKHKQNAGGSMSHTPTTLGSSALKPVITRYYKELERYQQKADYELALRPAFQNMLADAANLVNWTLVLEQKLEGNIRPDGVLRDSFDLRRGFWEAKGPKSDLEKEIQKKIADGYPLINTVFENTRKAILYQNKRRLPIEYDLTNPNDVRDLLSQLLTYTEPDIENFETAVDEFKERIPEHARATLVIIEREYKLNKRFVTAFNTFAELCRTSLNPHISTDTINEMLVQHLLTERLFSTVFNNPDFVRRNVIAAEIEKVIDALASRSFNRKDFLKTLDRFYVAIEGAAKGIESWSERQHFLNTVYERFFQGFSVKQADTFGIVYTPQEIVDFMCASVDEVLKQEFGKSIAEPGVQILDPSVGTGSFIVNLLHRIPRRQLKHKYLNDLFCNEIMLLPYYIASLNIEHEYYDKMGEYEPFEGICFADTLELAEGQQLSLWGEKNTTRVVREKDAQIMVVIGNPPYNSKQMNENDNNKNRRYPIIDKHIRETYVKASKASLTTKLYDVYVKFFRWATDRLQSHEGIVCFVSNNSFLDQAAFDGMRKHLLQDFTQIYHLDLHGNVRKNPKLSGTTHNVFGIQVGVGITIAIRSSRHTTRNLYYYRVPEDWHKAKKLSFLKEKGSISGINWLELLPNERYMWITEGVHSEYATFMPLGTKEAKALQNVEMNTVFKTYSLGVSTNRDNIVYDFDHQILSSRIEQFIEDYNGEVSRWTRANRPKDIDNFVYYDKVKWSEHLKNELRQERYCRLDNTHFRISMYRPFSKRWLYYDPSLNDRPSSFSKFLPVSKDGQENIIICLTDIAAEKPFMALVTNLIPDMHIVGAGANAQCFPFYTYSTDGTNRRENITDWALKQFQSKYGEQVTKWDIFHYVYALLHHPQYRERYTENLKRDLPHIPLLHNGGGYKRDMASDQAGHEQPVLAMDLFHRCVHIGKQLMDLHLHYEQAKEYPLEWVENESIPFSWRVEKMKLAPDKTAVVVNKSLTLADVPQECFLYRLGNRSALEWIIDQYQVSKDKRSGIESDPNNLDDEEYIVRLVGKVITVSVETVKLVNELAQAVTVEDWLDETVEAEQQL